MLKTYKDPSLTSSLVTFVPSAVCKFFPKLDTTSPTSVGMQRLRTKQTKETKWSVSARQDQKLKRKKEKI